MAKTPVMERLVARSLDRAVPLNVHMDITYRCNEKCVHCYLDHEDHGEMTTAEIRRVLDELALAGTLFLTFSGGEIFLRPDFFELVEHARDLRFDLCLKTNGILITKEKASRLRRLGVRSVQISIYSADAAVHDEITKVPGSLRRSLEAIRLLKEQGMVVKLACPLMRQNLGSFPGVKALAEELDIPYVLDLTITPQMDGNLNLLALRNPVESLLPILNDREVNPTTPVGEECKLGGDRPEEFDDIPCSAGMNSAYISPYGDVYPCVQLPLPTGNVRRQRFVDIWYHSSPMLRVRSVRDDQIEVCSGCSIRKYCERCPGLAYMEDGDMMGPSLRACELAETRARAAGIENAVGAYRLLRAERGVAERMGPGRAAGLIQIAPLTQFASPAGAD